MGGSQPYTDALADQIIARLAEGESLRSICRGENMPHESTVRSWVMGIKNADVVAPDFAKRFHQAREIGYLGMADELLEISDDGSNDWMETNDPNNPGWKFNGEHSQRSKLRVDTRKWVLCKMLPKIFGERQALDLNGEIHVNRIMLERSPNHDESGGA